MCLLRSYTSKVKSEIWMYVWHFSHLQFELEFRTSSYTLQFLKNQLQLCNPLNNE